MKTQASAEVFSAKVDEILARRGKRERPVVTSMYESRDLQLAERLAAVDLSAESHVLQELPRSLSARAAEGRGRKILRLALRPVPLAVGVLVVALAVVQCTYPGGVPALSKDVSQKLSKLVLSELQVGPHTVAQQSTGDQQALKEAVDAIPKEIKDRMWYVYAGGIGFGGGTPDGLAPVALEFPTIKGARSKAAFPFTTPGYLPDGASLAKAHVSPGGEQVILVYWGSEASFAISEAAVLDVTPASSSAMSNKGAPAQVSSVYMGVISDSPYTETFVGKAKAAWYGTGILVWEDAGISYALGVPGMSEEQAKRIAASLK